MPTFGDSPLEIKIPLLPCENFPEHIETGVVPNNSVNSASARRLPVVAALFHHPFFHLLFTHPHARKRRKGGTLPPFWGDRFGRGAAAPASGQCISVGARLRALSGNVTGSR